MDYKKLALIGAIATSFIATNTFAAPKAKPRKQAHTTTKNVDTPSRLTATKVDASKVSTVTKSYAPPPPRQAATANTSMSNVQQSLTRRRGRTPSASNANLTGTTTANGKVHVGPYSHLQDTKNPKANGHFTEKQKNTVRAENASNNQWTSRSDASGKKITTRKGAQVDHMDPRSKGGPNTTGNAQLLTAKENRVKSDKVGSQINGSMTPTRSNTGQPIQTHNVSTTRVDSGDSMAQKQKEAEKKKAKEQHAQRQKKQADQQRAQTERQKERQKQAQQKQTQQQQVKRQQRQAQERQQKEAKQRQDRQKQQNEVQKQQDLQKKQQETQRRQQREAQQKQQRETQQRQQRTQQEQASRQQAQAQQNAQRQAAAAAKQK